MILKNTCNLAVNNSNTFTTSRNSGDRILLSVSVFAALEFYPSYHVLVPAFFFDNKRFQSTIINTLAIPY